MANSRMLAVLGLPKAQAKFIKMQFVLNQALPLLLKAAALPVMNLAKAKAPYKSGTLRRSIHIESTGPESVAIGTNVVYAAAQEFGRPEINLPARPYLRPALDEAGPLAVAEVNKALSHLLAGA